MAHYEQRLAEDLQGIRSALQRVTDDISGSLERGCPERSALGRLAVEVSDLG